MREHLLMFAAYNTWANGRLYAAVGDLPEAELRRETGAFFRSMLGTLNHLLVADRIWLKRFTGEGEAPTRLDAVLFDRFEGLWAARRAEDQRIEAYLAGLGEDALAGAFSYTMLDGRTVTQRLAPALAHLFNHQAHHRGQAHGILTTLGGPSVSLDLLAFHRTEQGRRFA